MKNIIKSFLLSIAAISLFASCAQDNFSAPEGESLVFTATIANATRTSIDFDGTVGKVNWVAGDEILINGVAYVATPDPSDATKATFEKKNASDADAKDIFGEYYATYCCTFDPEAGEGIIPATQTYTSANMLPAPMVAMSGNTSFSFLNICGIIEINLKGTKTVKNIEVSADNIGLSGKFTVLDGQSATIIDNDKGSVTLDCGDGIALSSEGTKFYVPVPAGEYTGLKISVRTADDNSWSKTAVKTASVEANKIYSVEFTPEFAGSLARYSNDGGATWTMAATLKDAVEGAKGTSSSHAKVELLQNASHDGVAAINLSGKYVDIDGCGHTYDVSLRPAASDGAFSDNAVFSAFGGKEVNGSVSFTNITFDGKSTNNAAKESRLLYNQSGMEFTFGTGSVIKDITFQAYGQNKNAGGVLYNEFGTITIDGATVSNCCAKQYSTSFLAGGFIDNAGGTVNMKSGSVTDCKALEAASGGDTRGGFSYVTVMSSTAGTLNISGGTISGSKAQNGGVAFVSTSSKVNMTGGTISGCEASGNGGAFVNNASSNTFNMTGGTIDKCSAANGGAAYIAKGAALTVTGDALIKECSATKLGGALALNIDTKLYLSGDAVIKDCTSSTAGGGICNTTTGGSGLTIEMKGNAHITGCKALGGDGGGIRDNATASTMTVMENALIDNCSCTGKGGGLYQAGIYTIKGNVRIENCSAKNGGGIAVWRKATLDENFLIKNCTASGNGGGVFVTYNSTSTSYGQLTIQGNVKVEGCTAAMGGGIYTDNIKVIAVTMSGNASVVNCLAKASGDVTGGAVYSNAKFTVNSNALFSGNDVQSSNSGAIIAAAGSYGEVTINGGTFVSNSSSNSFAKAGSGSITLNGGYFNKAADGAAIASGYVFGSNPNTSDEDKVAYALGCIYKVVAQ